MEQAIYNTYIAEEHRSAALLCKSAVDNLFLHTAEIHHIKEYFKNQNDVIKTVPVAEVSEMIIDVVVQNQLVFENRAMRTILQKKMMQFFLNSILKL